MGQLEQALHQYYQGYATEAWLLVTGIFLVAWSLVLWTSRRRPTSPLQARKHYALKHPAQVECIWFLPQLEAPSKLWLCGRLRTGDTLVLANPEDSAAVCVQLQAHAVPLLVGGPRGGWTIRIEDLTG